MTTQLFPPIPAFKEEMLTASSLHHIYVEQSGNPEGTPILFVHGGPGGGTEPSFRQYFDPKHYRIILFDQRGCGKSTPSACVEENTTWDLVHDMELIRKHLGLRSWILFGGSWGTTLSLAYATKFPSKVKGLILRGIFLCRPQEINWFYQEGTSRLFPDLWESYLAPIPEEERVDLLAAYHKLLFSKEETVRLEAAKAWSKWEGGTSRLTIDQKLVQSFDDSKHALEFARIENHYFMNNAFFETANYLLENADKLEKIPGIIVHGRYDVVCPVENAWHLHKAWPSSKLHIIPEAGHSMREPGITQKLLEATEEFKSVSVDD